MKKRTLFFMVWSLGIMFILTGCYQRQEIKKINARNALQRQAKMSARAGDLDGAVKLYKQAIAPEYINKEHEKSTAMGALREIYKLEKKYSDALDAIHWFFVNSATGKPTPSALEEKAEIDVLIQYQLTSNPASAYAYIEHIKKVNKDYLPPVHYSSVGTTTAISTILRLYDTIKDYDAGIAYVDRIMEYFYSKTPDVQRVENVAQAEQIINERRANKQEWYPYKVLREYLLVRAAFEREKANGGPTCGEWGKIKSPETGSPDYCVGDATQALIQSDYFPW